MTITLIYLKLADHFKSLAQFSVTSWAQSWRWVCGTFRPFWTTLKKAQGNAINKKKWLTNPASVWCMHTCAHDTMHVPNLNQKWLFVSQFQVVSSPERSAGRQWWRTILQASGPMQRTDWAKLRVCSQRGQLLIDLKWAGEFSLWYWHNWKAIARRMP